MGRCLQATKGAVWAPTLALTRVPCSEELLRSVQDNALGDLWVTPEGCLRLWMLPGECSQTSEEEAAVWGGDVISCVLFSTINLPDRFFAKRFSVAENEHLGAGD